uniref:Ig-like domain-containing protein n=1 Tax=Coturnix japonica TaxID=93934 RepID=A0A8C2YHY0_COTJA
MKLLLLLLCCAELCLPGWALHGPSSMTGYIGGSLSVSCSYQEGYETYPKYWCHPGTLTSCSFKNYIITSEQQPWAQWGRISIWDNRTQRVFTVTMKDLTARDAGTYLCGVQRPIWQQDVTNKVQVIVLSGHTSCSFTALPSTSAIPSGPISGPTWMSPQQETTKQTAHPTSPGDLSEGQLNIVMDILIPCIAVVLFLLALAAVVLVILSRKRKKGKQSWHLCLLCPSAGRSDAEVLQYVDISHVGTKQRQLYSNVRAAPVSLQTDTEYSEVKKPSQNLAVNTETPNTQVCKIPLEEQEQLYANVVPRQQRAAQ